MNDYWVIAACGAAVVFLVSVALDQLGAWWERGDHACDCRTCDQCRQWEDS